MSRFLGDGRASGEVNGKSDFFNNIGRLLPAPTDYYRPRLCENVLGRGTDHQTALLYEIRICSPFTQSQILRRDAYLILRLAFSHSLDP